MELQGPTPRGSTNHPDSISLLNFHDVALLADVETLRRTQTIAQARGFVNVAAEKIDRFFAFDPGAKRGAADVLAGGILVQFCIVWRKVDDEMEFRNSIECGEG